MKHWTLTTLRDRLIKIGAKIVRHARYVKFQLAEGTEKGTVPILQSGLMYEASIGGEQFSYVPKNNVK